MAKKNNDDKAMSMAELKSVVSLLNEILGIVQKDLAIDLANQKKLTDIDIELSAQGKTLEELGKKVDILLHRTDDMNKKLDAILVLIAGSQIVDFTLDQIKENFK